MASGEPACRSPAICNLAGCPHLQSGSPPVYTPTCAQATTWTQCAGAGNTRTHPPTVRWCALRAPRSTYPHLRSGTALLGAATGACADWHLLSALALPSAGAQRAPECMSTAALTGAAQAPAPAGAHAGQRTQAPALMGTKQRPCTAVLTGAPAEWHTAALFALSANRPAWFSVKQIADRWRQAK